ncbi:MAG: LytTR family transcriptional regulator DNA-binding domain-containing protein, partial [Crocinitomicaceae bacterium]
VVDNILPPAFIRTHKSFAINMDYVAFIDEKEQSVILKTNDSVPIGKSFRKHVYEKMNIRT